MQVHLDTNTVWAFNKWAGWGVEVGIGNRPLGGGGGGVVNPDWTASDTSELYTSRELRVFVRRSCASAPVQFEQFNPTAPATPIARSMARFSTHPLAPTHGRFMAPTDLGYFATGTYFKTTRPLFGVFGVYPADGAGTQAPLPLPLLGWGRPPGITTSVAALDVVEGLSATYTVSLPTTPFANVSMTLFLLPPNADLTVEPTEFLFTPEDWLVPRTVTVTALEDDIDENSRVVYQLLHVVASDDEGYATADNATVAVAVRSCARACAGSPTRVPHGIAAPRRS